ncbi:hypothetical protein [Saccharopolyspora sp. NPDC050642]|uniref:hypothetical protein n=1 Tax=Saccharopolyspora sp. NPDC050642 TaxID=3157099 RepID=UPI0033DF81EB
MSEDLNPHAREIPLIWGNHTENVSRWHIRWLPALGVSLLRQRMRFTGQRGQCSRNLFDTEFAQQVLKMLYAGHTYEVAAQELAVSVRTYRRCVAEIVELLGANSRFQAGVRAAEVGLLPASP